MRLAVAFSFCALVLGVRANLDNLPTCSKECMAAELPQSYCAPTNITCICHDEPLLGKLSECVERSCTIKQALTTQNITNTMCGVPVQDITNSNIIVSAIFSGIAVISTAIRVSQWHEIIGIEDAFVILAFISGLAVASIEYPTAKLGFGRDIWAVPFDNITMILKLSYFVQISYITCTSSVKMGFLFFYRRIFPTRPVRIAIYTMMGLVGVYFIVFFFLLALNCRPEPYIWTHWTGEGEGTCLNLNALGIGCAIYNIILDFSIMLIPLYPTWKLNLRPWRKFLVMVMFCTGLFITVVSIIRLTVMLHFSNTKNETYNNAPAGYWSTIESLTSVVCVNMPAIRRFSKKVLVWCGMSDESTKGYRSYDKYGSKQSKQSKQSKRAKDLIITKSVDTTVTHGWASRRDSDQMELVDMENGQTFPGGPGYRT